MSSEQIEDILALLNEMGINVIENEEAEEAESDNDNEGESEGGALAEVKTGGALEKRSQAKARRPHRRPRAHVSARDGLRRALVARGAKSPLPSASRLAQAMIARLCESPLTFRRSSSGATS
ncbi:MAG: RNA polymerase sigma factor region1.1 domain-containing protein [Tepidamorphaceae bacterium]